MESTKIKHLIENALISAFSLKQPRKVTIEYNGVDYLIEVKREKYNAANIAVIVDGDLIAQNNVGTDYVPRYVINVLYEYDTNTKYKLKQQVNE